MNSLRVYSLGMDEINRLALFGGKPVIEKPFPKYNTIDETDVTEALRVIRTGSLSQFIGDAGDYFFGGPEVRSFEAEFAQKFEVKYAVSVNSWTSGLWVAIGALELEPGSEVITSAWTMAATATTLLHWNVVPVFADIDIKTFNLDPIDVESKITSRSKAIVAPDIFGQSADIEALREICKKYDLKLVSDSAQSPMATRQNYFAGTASDIGGYSFNYHKHIHTGEGGMLVTNNSELADRMYLLRNHGEVALSKRPIDQQSFGIMGMNMRLGEIESAIGKNQLLKLNAAVVSRQLSAGRFADGLKDLEGIITPFIQESNSHVYYVFGIKINTEILKVSRDSIIRALNAEGISSISAGYQNLHKLPLFKRQLTYRNNPIPYSLLPKERAQELRDQHLPNSELLHQKTFIGINWCATELESQEVDKLIEIFHKVWQNLDVLRGLD
jgi:perosamine synthetase